LSLGRWSLRHPIHFLAWFIKEACSIISPTLELSLGRWSLRHPTHFLAWFIKEACSIISPTLELSLGRWSLRHPRIPHQQPCLQPEKASHAHVWVSEWASSQCVVNAQTCVVYAQPVRCLRANLRHKSTHAWKWDASLALFTCRLVSQKHTCVKMRFITCVVRVQICVTKAHAWKWGASLALFTCRLASQKHTCVKMRFITCVVHVQTCVTKAHMRENEMHHLRCLRADLRHKSTHAWTWDSSLALFMCRLASQKHTCVKMRCTTCNRLPVPFEEQSKEGLSCTCCSPHTWIIFRSQTHL